MPDKDDRDARPRSRRPLSSRSVVAPRSWKCFTDVPYASAERSRPGYALTGKYRGTFLVGPNGH
jgi:hypothetical protein